MDFCPSAAGCQNDWKTAWESWFGKKNQKEIVGTKIEMRTKSSGISLAHHKHPNQCCCPGEGE